MKKSAVVDLFSPNNAFDVVRPSTSTSTVLVARPSARGHLDRHSSGNVNTISYTVSSRRLLDVYCTKKFLFYG